MFEDEYFFFTSNLFLIFVIAHCMSERSMKIKTINCYQENSFEKNKTMLFKKIIY